MLVVRWKTAALLVDLDETCSRRGKWSRAQPWAGIFRWNPLQRVIAQSRSTHVTQHVTMEACCTNPLTQGDVSAEKKRSSSKTRGTEVEWLFCGHFQVANSLMAVACRVNLCNSTLSRQTETSWNLLKQVQHYVYFVDRIINHHQTNHPTLCAHVFSCRKWSWPRTKTTTALPTKITHAGGTSGLSSHGPTLREPLPTTSKSIWMCPTATRSGVSSDIWMQRLGPRSGPRFRAGLVFPRGCPSPNEKLLGSLNHDPPWIAE